MKEFKNSIFLIFHLFVHCDFSFSDIDKSQDHRTVREKEKLTPYTEIPELVLIGPVDRSSA